MRDTEIGAWHLSSAITPQERRADERYGNRCLAPFHFPLSLPFFYSSSTTAILGGRVFGSAWVLCRRFRAGRKPTGGPPPPQAHQITQHLARVPNGEHPGGLHVAPPNAYLVDLVPPPS